MIPTYTTSVVLPKICLAFDWPNQMKILRTAPGGLPRLRAHGIVPCIISFSLVSSWCDDSMLASTSYEEHTNAIHFYKFKYQSSLVIFGNFNLTGIVYQTDRQTFCSRGAEFCKLHFTIEARQERKAMAEAPKACGMRWRSPPQTTRRCGKHNKFSQR